MARKKKKKKLGDELFEDNRKAHFDFQILEEFEAGIALHGSEVKSIRDGKISLKEAYCQFTKDELFLLQAHISEFTQAHARNHLPLRARKLLLHRRELDRLDQSVRREGLTVIPLAVYLQNRHIKLKIALARGKKTHDKRASIKEREQKREVQRAIRDGGR